MTENQIPTSPPDGTRRLDQTSETNPDQQLARDSRELENTMTLDPPSDAAIAEYLAHLSPIQRRYYNDLRSLGWDDASIHNLLTLLQNIRERILDQLRAEGKSEAEIERLSALCDLDITDYSHIKRPLADRAEQEYQVQLYLLAEVKRQRRAMLGAE